LIGPIYLYVPVSLVLTEEKQTCQANVQEKIVKDQWEVMAHQLQTSTQMQLMLVVVSSLIIHSI